MNISTFYGRKRRQAVDTVVVFPRDESGDELDGSDEENDEEIPVNEGESDELGNGMLSVKFKK